jgi:hypothetical protein
MPAASGLPIGRVAVWRQNDVRIAALTFSNSDLGGLPVGIGIPHSEGSMDRPTQDRQSD